MSHMVEKMIELNEVNELNESHRVSSIAWGKLCRNIKVELAKNPDERELIELYLKVKSIISFFRL